MRNVNSNVFRPGTTQSISASTSSAATSNAFATQVTDVMVTTTAACFVTFDATPTATTSHTYIAANTPYFFRVSEQNKCAAITASGTATVYVTELSR